METPSQSMQETKPRDGTRFQKCSSSQCVNAWRLPLLGTTTASRDGTCGYFYFYLVSSHCKYLAFIQKRKPFPSQVSFFDFKAFLDAASSHLLSPRNKGDHLKTKSLSRRHKTYCNPPPPPNSTLWPSEPFTQKRRRAIKHNRMNFI